MSASGRFVEDEAWVTLATDDTYALGALVVAHSLQRVGTSRKLAVLVTPGVTSTMRDHLSRVFDLVQVVNVLDSGDEANLALLTRPELGITFTKLNCWRLTQYKKCVFLDADTLVVSNCDELFDREELSAAPDVGWPDCFNSGVFVFRPSDDTYQALLQCALTTGSFDGGDQGLLNVFFSDWATKDIAKHLPFIYNMTSSVAYSYLPAYQFFGKDVKIVHFIGPIKPWHHRFNTATGRVESSTGAFHAIEHLQFWWNIFMQDVQGQLLPDLAGLAGQLALITLGQEVSPEQKALEDRARQFSWEQGQIDYLGADAFSNIQRKLDETLSTQVPALPEVSSQAAAVAEKPSDEPQAVPSAEKSGAEPTSVSSVSEERPSEAVADAASSHPMPSTQLKSSEVSESTQTVVSEPKLKAAESEPELQAELVSAIPEVEPVSLPSEIPSESSPIPLPSPAKVGKPSTPPATIPIPASPPVVVAAPAPIRTPPTAAAPASPPVVVAAPAPIRTLPTAAAPASPPVVVAAPAPIRTPPTAAAPASPPVVVAAPAPIKIRPTAAVPSSPPAVATAPVLVSPLPVTVVASPVSPPAATAAPPLVTQSKRPSSKVSSSTTATAPKAAGASESSVPSPVDAAGAAAKPTEPQSLTTKSQATPKKPSKKPKSP